MAETMMLVLGDLLGRIRWVYEPGTDRLTPVVVRVRPAKPAEFDTASLSSRPEWCLKIH